MVPPTRWAWVWVSSGSWWCWPRQGGLECCSIWVQLEKSDTTEQLNNKILYTRAPASWRKHEVLHLNTVSLGFRTQYMNFGRRDTNSDCSIHERQIPWTCFKTMLVFYQNWHVSCDLFEIFIILKATNKEEDLFSGTSLMGQWLRLQASNSGSTQASTPWCRS